MCPARPHLLCTRVRARPSDVANILNNLAGICADQGRGRALGPDHPAVAAAVAALAALLDAQGQDAEAEALYRRALRIFTRLYGLRAL